MTRTISTFEFPNASEQVANVQHGANWPVVYLIHNSNELYIGETTSAYVRYGQHADRNGKYYNERKRLNKIEIIFDDTFNKSAILDIEQSLIQMFEVDGSIQRSRKLHSFSLQNKNGGQSNQHDYYNRCVFQSQIESIWNDLRKKGLASNDYFTIRNSDLFKYSPYNSLTCEQEKVCSDIIRDMMRHLLNGTQGTAILKGAAGTGKSIVLINMISTLINSQKANFDYDTSSEEASEVQDRFLLHSEINGFMEKWKGMGNKDLKIAFIVPMDSIRTTFKFVFSSTKGLVGNMVIGPNEVVGKGYDVVFVDESHRLKRRMAMSGTEMGAFDKCCERLGLDRMTATNLDFILKETKYQVMVYDENQTVKSSDIPNEVYRSKISQRKVLEKELISQMRCKGGRSFMKYIDEIFSLSARRKEAVDGFDFKLFDDPNALIEFIREQDAKEHLCRTLAGYSWEWVSSKERIVHDGPSGPVITYRASSIRYRTLSEIKAAGRDPDIELCGKKYYWNVNPSQWILKSDPEEIGCIHTTQGYDLNRVGVIFGKEIDYDPKSGQIVIDRKKFYDQKVKEKTTDEELKRYIINAYKVMLARGIRGCYVYACNENLQNYLKQFIDTFSRTPSYDDAPMNPYIEFDVTSKTKPDVIGKKKCPSF